MKTVESTKRRNSQNDVSLIGASFLLSQNGTDMTESKRPKKYFYATPTRTVTPCANSTSASPKTTWTRGSTRKKPCGERSAVLSLSKHRTIFPPVAAPQVQEGQGFDRVDLPDWELEIRRTVHGEIVEGVVIGVGFCPITRLNLSKNPRV